MLGAEREWFPRMSARSDDDLDRHLQLVLTELEQTKLHTRRALERIEELGRSGGLRFACAHWIDLRAGQVVLAAVSWCVSRILRAEGKLPEGRGSLALQRHPRPPAWQ